MKNAKSSRSSKTSKAAKSSRKKLSKAKLSRMKSLKSSQSPKNSKLTNFLFCLGFLVLIGLIFATSVIITLRDNTIFALQGGDISLQLGDDYREEGFVAKTLGVDLADLVQQKSNLDTTEVGVYQINYELVYLERSHQLTRTVRVTDNVAPIITLSGKEEVKIYVDDVFKDDGATASDNYDGDITEKIEVSSDVNNKKAGTYHVDYKVSDSSGNESTVTRTVTVMNRPVPQSYSAASVPSITSEQITQYINSRGYDVAVGYYNLVTGKSYYYQPNRVIYGASMIKTLDADYLFEKGMVTDALRPYIKRAITYSDNSAHRYLVDYIGKDNYRAYGVSIGAPHTLSDPDGGYFSDTTVMEQMAYFKKLYSLTLSYPELRGYFQNNVYYWLNSNGVAVMHKSGYYGYEMHDAGIYLDKQPYIIVVLTEHATKNGTAVIRDISSLLYRFHRS